MSEERFRNIYFIVMLENKNQSLSVVEIHRELFNDLPTVDVGYD